MPASLTIKIKPPEIIGTHFYPWLVLGTERVECHAKDHNKMNRVGGEPILIDTEKFSCVLTIQLRISHAVIK